MTNACALPVALADCLRLLRIIVPSVLNVNFTFCHIIRQHKHLKIT